MLLQHNVKGLFFKHTHPPTHNVNITFCVVTWEGSLKYYLVYKNDVLDLLDVHTGKPHNYIVNSITEFCR